MIGKEIPVKRITGTKAQAGRALGMSQPPCSGITIGEDVGMNQPPHLEMLPGEDMGMNPSTRRGMVRARIGPSSMTMGEGEGRVRRDGMNTRREEIPGRAIMRIGRVRDLDTTIRGTLPHRDSIIRVDRGLHPNSMEMISNTIKHKTPITREVEGRVRDMGITRGKIKEREIKGRDQMVHRVRVELVKGRVQGVVPHRVPPRSLCERNRDVWTPLGEGGPKIDSSPLLV